NGDGVAETQSLTYKIVRPSTVTVQLRGPDGVLRVNTQTQLAPGTYPFQWNARRADGTPEVEGTWNFTVGATDDLGRTASAERDFTLDRPLGTPSPISPARLLPRPNPRPATSRALTRQARVAEQIETPKGVLIRRLGTVTAGPGALSVAWNGKTASGANVYSGRYVVRVTATSSVGTSDLTAPFTVRR